MKRLILGVLILLPILSFADDANFIYRCKPDFDLDRNKFKSDMYVKVIHVSDSGSVSISQSEKVTSFSSTKECNKKIEKFNAK